MKLYLYFVCVLIFQWLSFFVMASFSSVFLIILQLKKPSQQDGLSE